MRCVYRRQAEEGKEGRGTNEEEREEAEERMIKGKRRCRQECERKKEKKMIG